MKRVALLTVVLLATTTMAYAHCGMCKLDKKGKSPEDWQKKKIEKMTEELSLTEEQVPAVEALVKEKIEKKKAIKEECRTNVKSVKEEYSGKIRALLDEGQKEKFDEMKKGCEAEMKGKKCDCPECMLKGKHKGKHKEDKAGEKK
jgi:hypothetical protein